jgi:hypothetical protein
MRPVVKIIAEALSQHDEKHVVPTTLSGIRVGKENIKNRKSKASYNHRLITLKSVSLEYYDISHIFILWEEPTG